MLNHWIIPGGCPGFFVWVLGSENELLLRAGSAGMESKGYFLTRPPELGNLSVRFVLREVVVGLKVDPDLWRSAKGL